jgi:kumamolisin
MIQVAERKVFHDSVVPLPDQAGLTTAGEFHTGEKPHDMTARRTLQFVLAPSPDDQAELEATVARGAVVAPQELHERFGVAQASVAALEDWLRGQGFEVEHVTKDGTSIYASAPLSVIERSLGVDMVDVTKDGYRYAAARQAPSLPAEVAGDVSAIIGLQPYRQARKHLRRAPLVPADADTANDTPASRTNGYLVQDILGAYGAAAVEATGSDQTIAILIDTFPLESDLQQFWAANDMPDELARIDMINVANGPLPEISGEESLDAQWSSGIAPDAKVRVYASGGLDFVSLDHALDRIISDLSEQPSLRQLSMSLGLGETYFGSAKGEIATQHQKFLRLAAAGVNVFVSSGDAGSNPDPTGHGSTGPTQVEYEASDPCVVAVGGTSLRLNADGTVAEETAWTGSGGGKSIVFERPTWQKGPTVPDGSQRDVPDVALVADPATGGMVVIHGEEQSVGGTSWAAPVWAALCARINDARSKEGKPLLGFLNPLLYPLAQTAAFLDVTTGSNGAYDAAVGYDMVTGLGTPNVAALLEALPQQAQQ